MKNVLPCGKDSYLASSRGGVPAARGTCVRAPPSGLPDSILNEIVFIFTIPRNTLNELYNFIRFFSQGFLCVFSVLFICFAVEFVYVKWRKEF